MVSAPLHLLLRPPFIISELAVAEYNKRSCKEVYIINMLTFLLVSVCLLSQIILISGFSSVSSTLTITNTNNASNKSKTNGNSNLSKIPVVICPGKSAFVLFHYVNLCVQYKVRPDDCFMY